MKFLTKIFNKKEKTIYHPAPKTVFLIKYNDSLVIVNAVESQSGWIANWTSDNSYRVNNDCWSLLLKGGKVEGTDLVIGWKPHSNWSKEELEKMGF